MPRYRHPKAPLALVPAHGQSALATLFALATIASCERRTAHDAPQHLATRPHAAIRQPTTRALPPTRLATPERLVAIGDLHGDLHAMRAVLQLAGVLDTGDRWSGGQTVVVQTGDVLDRGSDERAMLDLLSDLSEEARATGGALIVLNGNHELMNVQGDFRYVTPGGFADFASFADDPRSIPAPSAVPSEARGRTIAFAPSGPYASVLAQHDTIVVVGDTVFVHGGLLPEHVDYGLERINESVHEWMLGRGELPDLLRSEQSPVWLRRYALEDDSATCDLLADTLRRARATRMVVGHTVQQSGITSACDQRVWRIDVGLARVYGGPTEALEIRGPTVRVLR